MAQSIKEQLCGVFDESRIDLLDEAYVYTMASHLLPAESERQDAEVRLFAAELRQRLSASYSDYEGEGELGFRVEDGEVVELLVVHSNGPDRGKVLKTFDAR